jgi:hypothetical protein
MVILPEAVMKSDPVGRVSPLRPLIIPVTAIRIPPRRPNAAVWIFPGRAWDQLGNNNEPKPSNKSYDGAEKDEASQQDRQPGLN